MFKTFSTYTLAVLMAISLSATPKQAQAGNDTAKIIAGVAALAIIGSSLSKNNNHRSQTHSYRYNNHYSDGYSSHRYNKGYAKPYGYKYRNGHGYKHGYGYSNHSYKRYRYNH